MGLDQVRPGDVGRGEAALDGVGGAPFAQGQVVEDHGKRLAAGRSSRIACSAWSVGAVLLRVSICPTMAHSACW